MSTRKNAQQAARGKQKTATMAISPDGKALTLDTLPPPGTKRWVIRRKAEVVAGVRSGIISLEEACRRYDLSVDEFRSWQRLLKDHGVQGLRVTRTKKYRRTQYEIPSAGTEHRS